MVSWDGRLRAIAAMIEPGEAVIDLGAGCGSLEQYLPHASVYLAIDRIQRYGAMTLDLASDIPHALMELFDVAVISGVLEHMEPRPALELLEAAIRSTPVTIATYDHTSSRGHKWKSNITQSEIVEVIESIASSVSVSHWGEQTLYRVEW